jgi:hypothetical protein
VESLAKNTQVDDTVEATKEAAEATEMPELV